MIGNVLTHAVRQIEEYQRRFPDTYQDVWAEIENLKTVVDVLCQKLETGPENYYAIDPTIRHLIDDLNNSGYETFASCQGKRSMEDFENGSHCEYAFISFCYLPRRIKRKAKELGLHVYNRGMSIAPAVEDKRPETYIRHNLAFLEKVRALFNLNRMRPP